MCVMIVTNPCYFPNYTSTIVSFDEWKVVVAGSLCPYLNHFSLDNHLNDSAQVQVYIGANMVVYSHRIVI